MNLEAALLTLAVFSIMALIFLSICRAVIFFYIFSGLFIAAVVLDTYASIKADLEKNKAAVECK